MRNAEKLVRLAKKRFDLGAVGEEFLRKIGAGLVFDRRIGDESIDDPANSDEWDNARVLEAGIIVWLCTDFDASKLVPHKGIQVKGVRIDGNLDLAFARISFGLFFKNCIFSKEIDLRSSQICTLNLSGSILLSIDASDSVVENGIFLRDGFQANGVVCLDGVTIGGSLDCSGGFFLNPRKSCLEANVAKVSGNVFLSHGFKAEGMVGLVGMEIGGNLECNQGEFINKDKVALNANGLRVRGDVFLCEGFWGKGQAVQAAGFRAEGEVKFVGAKIGGSLECRGGEFLNPNGPALQGKGIRVDGCILLHDGFKSVGSVNLVGAIVGGNLECNCGKFINSGNTSLDAERISVKGNVFLCADSWGDDKLEEVYFLSEGEVKFIRAEIGGSFDCTGGHFSNDNKCALNAMHSEIYGNIFMRNGFISKGTVSLVGSTIGGNFECNQGLFISNNETTLDAERVKVAGDVFLCTGFWGDGKEIVADGFKAEGEVKLVGAVIDGTLKCIGGHFAANKVNPKNGALNLLGATIKKEFVWTEIVSPKNVMLNLKSAIIGEYFDDKASWPAKKLLNITGMTYTSIQEINNRREWLGLQKEFQHQPYEQLASVLRKEGRDGASRKVLLTKAEDRARKSEMSRAEKLFHKFLGLTIGYGYFPWRAFKISILIVLLGWGLFGLGKGTGLITNTKEMEYVGVSRKVESAKSELREDMPEATINYPKYGSLIYSIDVFVPLVDLHQSEYWQPNANEGTVLFSLGFRVKLFSLDFPVRLTFTSGGLLRLYMWFHIIAGWLLTTLLIAGLSGFVKR